MNVRPGERRRGESREKLAQCVHIPVSVRGVGCNWLVIQQSELKLTAEGRRRALVRKDVKLLLLRGKKY